ncbi:MAG TPA: quinoprotein relay system zinc metallohydrolase 2 [Methylophilaceae bacterium]
MGCSVALADGLKLESAGDQIYVHHGIHEDISEGYHGDICNISFVIGSKGVAVIDTGGSLKVGQQLHDAIRKITPLPILYVINTHVHPDHIFGNAAFVQDKPQFVGHAKLADAMERRRESYTRINNTYLGDDAVGSDFIKPTIPVQTTAELDLGDRKLTVTAYPTSHTNTDITVLDSKSKTLWSGDLLFVERTPSIDGDIKGWIASIDQLKQSDASQIIAGHGAIAKDWKTALNNEQRYLNVLLSDVRTSIKKGIIMETTMDSAAATEKDKWVLFDIVNRRNVNNIYPALEWE